MTNPQYTTIYIINYYIYNKLCRLPTNKIDKIIFIFTLSLHSANLKTQQQLQIQKLE